MKALFVCLSVIGLFILGCSTPSATIQRPFKRSATIDTITTSSNGIIIHKPQIVKPQVIKPTIIKQ